MVYCWRKENDKKKKKENGGRNRNWNSISDDLNCNLQLLGKKKRCTHSLLDHGAGPTTQLKTSFLSFRPPLAFDLAASFTVAGQTEQAVFRELRGKGREGKGREGKGRDGRTDGRDSRRKVLFTQLVGPARENLLFTQNDPIFPFSKTDDWTFSTEWLIKMHNWQPHSLSGHVLCPQEANLLELAVRLLQVPIKKRSEVLDFRSLFIFSYIYLLF